MERSKLESLATSLDVVRLIGYLLDQPWHERCEIIPEYMPPFPGEKTRAKCVVRYDNGTEYPAFLRHSKGPKQGFSWDVFGDDFLDIELAVIAIASAPAPVSFAPIKVQIPLGRDMKEKIT